VVQALPDAEHRIAGNPEHADVGHVLQQLLERDPRRVAGRVGEADEQAEEDAEERRHGVLDQRHQGDQPGPPDHRPQVRGQQHREEREADPVQAEEVAETARGPVQEAPPQVTRDQQLDHPDQEQQRGRPEQHQRSDLTQRMRELTGPLLCLLASRAGRLWLGTHGSPSRMESIVGRRITGERSPPSSI
jgi:hypothetical protein